MDEKESQTASIVLQKVNRTNLHFNIYLGELHMSSCVFIAHSWLKLKYIYEKTAYNK